VFLHKQKIIYLEQEELIRKVYELKGK